MTEPEKPPEEAPAQQPAGSEPGDDDKLDLAALAERLARSEKREADKSDLPEAAQPEAGGAALPEVKVSERQLSGAEVFAAIEALLFAADHPLTAAQIARALPQGVGAREVRQQLSALAESLEGAERGYELREIAGGWQLLTREKYAPYVLRLKRAAAAKKLSGSALETLAVVAYKQPVSRAEIERIRGVNCGEILRTLLEKRLVRIAGRSKELGSPLLYGTTQEFLEHFGLNTIGDLPRSAELGRKPSAAKPAGEAPAPATPAAPPVESPAEPPAEPAPSDPSDKSDQSDKSDIPPAPEPPPQAS